MDAVVGLISFESSANSDKMNDGSNGTNGDNREAIDSATAGTIETEDSARGQGRNEMGFDATEGVFYAVLFIAAGAATLIRSYRDNRRYSGRTLVGRCCTGGLIGSGIVALWLGSGAHPASAGGYYFLFAAALIGFFNQEIQERALNPLIDIVLSWTEKLLGVSKRKNDGRDEGEQ